MRLSVAYWLTAVPLLNSFRWLLGVGRREKERRGFASQLLAWRWLALALVLCYAPGFLVMGLFKAWLSKSGIGLDAFGAFAWWLVSVFSLAYGFLGAIGASIQLSMAQEEPLHSLPLMRRELAAAKVAALEVEGLFWFLLLGYPLMAMYWGMAAGSPVAQAGGGLLNLVVFVSLCSLGIGSAYGLLLLRPSTKRTPLAVKSLCICIAGVGIGTVAAFSGEAQARGGGLALFRIAESWAAAPYSPVYLPHRISLGALHGRPWEALGGFMVLLAVTAIFLGLSYWATRACYDRLSLTEED